MAIFIKNRFPKYISLGYSSKPFMSKFLTWGQSVPARFWGDETPEYWGGIDPQAQIAYDSLIAAGFTVPQGLGGINAAFLTIKDIYGTSDITTAISFFGDPSLAYQIGAGSGTTLGQAIRTLPNIIDPTRATDAVQTTAASQPLLLVHSGANYWQGVGVNGNYVSTPDAAANRFLSNIAMWGKIRLQDYNVASTNTLVAKRPFSGNMSYFFGITAGGTLFLRISNDGNQSNANQGATSSVSLTSVATNGQDISVGVFRNSSTGDVIFYYSLDNTNWIQLGTTISTAAVGIFNTNLAVGVGGYSDGVTTITGRIYYMNVSDTWLGTPSVSFNPNQYNPSTSQTQWTSSTGEVWTINTGTAATGFKGALVDRTIVQGDGIADNLRAASFSINLPAVTIYTAFKKFNNTANFMVGCELSANYNSFSGFLLSINEFASTEGVGIRGNAVNASYFNSSSILLKLSTSIGDTTLLNPETSLLINNTSASVFSNPGNANNTANINGSALNLFSRNGVSAFANINFNTIIISSSNNTLSQNTAIYNYIKSINNNAF
jgi:hypothetical protein